MRKHRRFIVVESVALLAAILIAGAGSDTGTGARTLKQSAVQRLAACEAQTSGKVATYIGRAKTAVERSLVWQGDDLFVTENFILPPSDGARVFNQEQTAVRWINNACAYPSTTPAM